jgi:hypothetical protein
MKRGSEKYARAMCETAANLVENVKGAVKGAPFTFYLPTSLRNRTPFRDSENSFFREI